MQLRGVSGVSLLTLNYAVYLSDSGVSFYPSQDKVINLGEPSDQWKNLYLGALILTEGITFTGATTENTIQFPANLPNALSFQEGANLYITVITTTGEKDILFNVPIDIHHTASIADDHAVEIDMDAAGFGDIKALDVDYITGVITAGEDEGIILINIDKTIATGGEVFALEVLATDQVSGTTNVHGLKTGPGVEPVHQDSGTFANPTLATDNTADTDVSVMRDGILANTTTIFEAQNEYIIIGADAAFQDMELVFSTAANKSIKPTFWYSTVGTGQFTQFTPVDGTDGCKHTGVISWDASDLSGHVADTGTGKFDIKIIRTRNTMTAPVLGYAKTAATTEYVWDKSGNLVVATVDTGQGANELYDMDQDVLTTSNLTFDGLLLTSVIDAGVDTDKFLVLDASNNVDYRTGAETLSDIGAIDDAINWALTFGSF